jgi:protein SCO1/2
VVVVPTGRGDFEHNAALLVFDARGRMVRVFDLAEQQLALDYARHLARGPR